MSDNSFGQVQTNISASAAKENLRKSDPSSDNENVLEILKDQLVTEGVKPARADKVVHQIVATVTAQYHSGPLPTVETFQGYEAACKGSARDIVDMAIRQQKHVNSMDKIAAYSALILPVVAIFAAVAIIVTMIVIASQVAVAGHDWVAAAIVAGGGIAAVVGSFLQGGKPPAQDSPEQTKPKRRRN